MLKDISSNEQIWFAQPILSRQDATMDRLHPRCHRRCSALLTRLYSVFLGERFNRNAASAKCLYPLQLVLLTENTAHLAQVVVKDNWPLKVARVCSPLNVSPCCMAAEEISEQVSRAEAIIARYIG
jgi:hypothetical protein